MQLTINHTEYYKDRKVTDTYKPTINRNHHSRLRVLKLLQDSFLKPFLLTTKMEGEGEQAGLCGTLANPAASLLQQYIKLPSSVSYIWLLLKISPGKRISHLNVDNY